MCLSGQCIISVSRISDHNRWKMKVKKYLFQISWYVIYNFYWILVYLTHWGRVTHICVGKLTIIASDNGLSPERHQAIIWTNAGLLLIGPLRTNFSEILIGIQTSLIQENVLENVVREIASILSRPQCVKAVIMKLFCLLHVTWAVLGLIRWINW